MRFYNKLVGTVCTLLIVATTGCGGGNGNADLGSAKAAVTELRNWATKLREFKTAGANSQTQMAQNLATTGTQVAYDTVSESLSLAVDAVVSAYKTNVAADGTYALADYIGPSYYYGLVTPPNPTGNIVIDNTAGAATITNGTLYGDTINIEVSLPSATVAKSFNINIISASVTNAKAFAQIDQGTMSLNYENEVDILDPTTDPVPNSASMVLHITTGQKETEFDNAVKFTGKFEGSVLIQPELRREVNPEHVLMSGTYSNELGESFSGSFEAFMRNAATFNPIPSSLDTPVGDVASYYFSVNQSGNSVLTINYTYSGQVSTFEFVPAINGGGTVNIDANGFVYSDPSIYPDFITFLAQSYYTSGGGYDFVFDGAAYKDYFFSFPVSYDVNATAANPVLISGYLSGSGPSEDASRWRDIDGTIKFAATFDGLPEASVILQADVKAYRKVAGKITISYDNVIMELSLDDTNFQDNVETGSSDLVNADLIVTVTEADGSKIVLTVTMSTTTTIDNSSGFPIADTTFSGGLTVNGENVGTVVEDIAPDTLIINYIDGTFESLVF